MARDSHTIRHIVVRYYRAICLVELLAGCYCSHRLVFPCLSCSLFLDYCRLAPGCSCHVGFCGRLHFCGCCLAEDCGCDRGAESNNEQLANRKVNNKAVEYRAPEIKEENGDEKWSLLRVTAALTGQQINHFFKGDLINIFDLSTQWGIYKWNSVLQENKRSFWTQ